MALKHLIQNRIIEFTKASVAFRTVSYDDANLASVSVPVLGSTVLASCHVNEVSCRFEVDTSHGRAMKQQRTDWAFQLRVKFNQEVSVEDFEQAWLDAPLILSREDTSSKQVTLFLLSSDYSHPPQQSSSTGSTVIFTIRAHPSRN